MDTQWRGDAAATTFAQLPLRAPIQRALAAMGFHTPSPIQLKALPIALFGSDVIGQAKSGTGKTAVFGVTAVEHVLNRLTQQQQLPQEQRVFASDPFALILAPTREIAMQIDSVLRDIASESQAVSIVPLIGGMPIAQDQKRLRGGCHVAVGTPGRVRWLIEDGVLRVKSIRLLILDEVDKLLSGEFLADIDSIVAALPDRRQTLAFSATFTPEQLVHVVRLMRDPQVVRVRGPNEVTVELVSSDEKQLTTWIEREKQTEPELWLRHVRQLYRVVNPKHVTATDHLNLKPKLVLLASLLSEIAFNQCIVFCNDKFRAEALATALESQGWPTAAITGAQSQVTRNSVMSQFRAFELRVLVSTDLTARGIDVDKVNFVVNLDLPRDPATYLHRVGRTGRFGGKHGLAVTLLTESEVEGIHLLSRVFKMAVDLLPTPAPRDVQGYVVAETEAADSVPSSSGKELKTRDTEGEDGYTSDVESLCEEVEEAKVRDKASSEKLQAADDDEPRDVASTEKGNSHVSSHRKKPSRSPEQADDTLNHAQVSKPPPSAAFAWEERNYEQWLQLVR